MKKTDNPQRASMRRCLKPLAAAIFCAGVALGVGAQPAAGIPTGGPTSVAATIKARQHMFGFENVNPANGDVRRDRVIISWLTTTTFAVAANGKVFMLDGYIDDDQVVEPPARKRTPTGLQELVDLSPEWIFIGHGHNDHTAYIANVAYRTGATIFGAQEHCDGMQVDAGRQFGAGATVKCTALLAAGVPIGTAAMNLAVLKPALCLNVMRHLHGAATPPDTSIPFNGIEFRDGEDPREFELWGTGPVQYPAVRASGGGGSLSVLYQFTVPGPRAFSFSVYDSVGPYKELAPELIPALRAWPATDLLIGAVSGANNPTNGMRDAAIYIRDIQPKVFVPSHHDESQRRRGAAGNSGEWWKRNLLTSMTNIGIPAAEQPEVRWLNDPYDYIRPSLLTFDPSSARWAKAGARTNATCN
jgi:L-ascorbate metabolism protein UlaG (beta-lactamase superfamily)